MMRCAPVLLIICASLAASALAQVPDPTRPADVAAADAAAGDAGRGVQMVMIRSPGKKPGAIINGRYVETGDKLDGKRVLKITETEVVLQGNDGRDVVKLTPAAEKTPTIKQIPRGSAHDRKKHRE